MLRLVLGYFANDCGATHTQSSIIVYASALASWDGECIIEYVNSPDKPTLDVYAQMANSSVNAEFRGELGVPAASRASYAKMLGRRANY